MLIKKIDLSSKYNNLYVIDNVFTASEEFGLFKSASTAFYQKTNYDSIAGLDLPVYNKWRCDLTSEELMSVEQIPEKLNSVFSEIFDNSNININISHSYINYSDSFTVDRMHVDRYNEYNHTPFTVLIYGNHEWSYDWKGETVFYNDMLEEIEYTSMVKPGRILIFDSRLAHSATPPSLIAKHPRYTYAIKASIN